MIPLSSTDTNIDVTGSGDHPRKVTGDDTAIVHVELFGRGAQDHDRGDAAAAGRPHLRLRLRLREHKRGPV